MVAIQSSLFLLQILSCLVFLNLLLESPSVGGNQRGALRLRLKTLDDDGDNCGDGGCSSKAAQKPDRRKEEGDAVGRASATASGSDLPLEPASISSSAVRNRSFDTVDTAPALFGQQQQQQQQSNRTRVILLGNIRSSEAAWESLYQNVLDPNLADLALLVPVDSKAKAAQENTTTATTPPAAPSLYGRAKYVWECPDFGNDWGAAIDLIDKGEAANYNNESSITARSEKDRRELTWRDFLPYQRYALGGIKERRKGSGAIIFALRWFAAQKIRKLGLIKEYRSFIITRNDFFFLCQHPPVMNTDDGLNPRSIWVPNTRDSGGICDRHVVCGAQDVLAVLDVLPPLVQDPGSYIAEAQRMNQTILNSEQFLKMSWKMNRIWDRVRRFPTVMFTTATANDTTRWRQAEKPVPGKIAKGLLIKYPDEFKQARKTCRRYNAAASS